MAAGAPLHIICGGACNWGLNVTAVRKDNVDEATPAAPIPTHHHFTNEYVPVARQDGVRAWAQYCNCHVWLQGCLQSCIGQAWGDPVQVYNLEGDCRRVKGPTCGGARR